MMKKENLNIRKKFDKMTVEINKYNVSDYSLSQSDTFYVL